MLALPIPTVWKVPYSLPHKIGIIAAFLCGGFSTLASCIRLYSIRVYTESPQPLRDAAPINTWSFIEINIGICCASVAVIRQFVASSSRQNSLSSTNHLASSTGTSTRKRTNTSSTGQWFSQATSPTSTKHTHTTYQAENIARWPSPAKSREMDIEAGPVEMPVDIDGTPIRQSMPLPPSPAYKQLHSSGGDTALPQKGPMLKAFVTWEHDGASLTSLSPVTPAAKR